jgi:hypothetical protein
VRNAYKILISKLGFMELLGDIGTDGRIILKIF